MRSVACGLALVLGSCVHRPEVGPPSQGPARYDVAVAAASGNRSMTSLYTLEVTPLPPDVWAFRTIHSEGTWEEGGERLQFDSSAPKPSEPWPIVQHHAVAGVAARVRLSEAGVPVAMVDEQRWEADARQALHALGLPPEAVRSGEALVDPGGVVRDLARDFPGVPPAEGAWVRSQRLAGVEGRRVEDCVVAAPGARTVWTCEGRIESPPGGPALLHDVTTWTTVEVDRRGVVQIEDSYAGTLVVLGPDGTGVLDRAIAGRRLVQRR